MKVSALIIGLLAFVAVGLMIFTFVGDLYSPEGLDVMRLFDNKTQSDFNSLQSSVESTSTETNQFGVDLQTYAPGGSNQTLGSSDLTSFDATKAALRSVMETPRVLTIFGSILFSISSAIGISSTLMGFILSAMIISVIMLIIGINFFREL